MEVNEVVEKLRFRPANIELENFVTSAGATNIESVAGGEARPRPTVISADASESHLSFNEQFDFLCRIALKCWAIGVVVAAFVILRRSSATPELEVFLLNWIVLPLCAVEAALRIVYFKTGNARAQKCWSAFFAWLSAGKPADSYRVVSAMLESSEQSVKFASGYSCASFTLRDEAGRATIMPHVLVPHELYGEVFPGARRKFFFVETCPGRNLLFAVQANGVTREATKEAKRLYGECYPLARYFGAPGTSSMRKYLRSIC